MGESLRKNKGERAGSGPRVPEDRDCGETGSEEKAQELEPGPKEEREEPAKRYLWGRLGSCLS